MPYRTWTFWGVLLGVTGLAVLGLCLAFGVDPRKAARTGPRWKRKLLTATLTLLGIATVSGIGDSGRAKASGPMCYLPIELPFEYTPPHHIPNPHLMQPDIVTLSPTATKAQQDQWDQAVAAWRQGREIAARERMTYPLTAAEQTRLLADLKTAATNVARLHADKLIDKPMADLFGAELADLTQAVNWFRPRPDPDGRTAKTSCYNLMMTAPTPRPSLSRLTDRLDELESIAAAERLSPAVAGQTARIIRRDLQLLASPVYRRRLGEGEQKRAAVLVAKTTALLAKLNAPTEPTAPSALALTERWKEFQALRGRGRKYVAAGSTTAQRTQWDTELAEARKNLGELANRGRLSSNAAAILTGQLKDIRKAIYAKPPTDFQARCYKTMRLIPARISLANLDKRLPMLEGMLKHGRLRPAVVAAMLPGLQADLKNLTDPAGLKLLGEADQAKAKAVAARLDAALKDLATIAPPPKPKATSPTLRT